MATSASARERTRGIDRTLAAGALLLLLAAVVGILLVLRFAEAERERELRTWQIRLGIVADSRVAAVHSWLEAQLDEMSGLAENASVQLYASQLAAAGDQAERDALAIAQADYLRNLLIVTAERAGFAAPSPQSAVRANVARVGTSGLAILDASGTPLVATPAMPPIEGELAAFVRSLPPGERGIMDIHLNAAGRPAMAFAAPIFAIQTDPGTSDRIGYVVGLKEVADELYPRLEQPGETAPTAHAELVRTTDGVIEYLSPLPDGTPPLTLKMSGDTSQLDAAFAVANPGGFAVRRDHRNRDVLLTSRAFSAVPWTLMYKVEREVALAESDARLNRLTAILVISVIAAASLMLAFWWYGSSRRAAQAAQRYRDAMERLEHQRNLLRVVTDSQPTSIFILDEEGRYRFANGEAGRRAGIPPADMLGKPIANVLGPDAARRHLELARRVLASGTPESDTERAEIDGKTHVVKSDYVPVPATSEAPRGVLVVESDITEAVTERERRARIQAQLVRTLVDVVDRRDPFAGAHSARVARIARAVAEEMGLDPREVETAEIAGNLLNLGKILIDRDILTRSGQLSEAERQGVRHSIQAGADLLQEVDFEGPVVETLRQAQAHWDGSGTPEGLAGEDILITARIIAVANAFVGMISPRAHRPALPVDAAVQQLLDQVGTRFDRRVVAAFVNWLDNRGGREEIAKLRPPSAG